MAGLQFYDYHNMVVILEKGEFNVDFHPMVDFIEASPLRIETTDEGTQILATVDGITRTITESSLRRNIKLQDEEGISSLPNTELFENLTLMGYNISPNQKFTFQKGNNIATALVCLATNLTYNFSKMIFDGLVNNVTNKISKFLMYPRKLFTTLRVNSPSFSGRIVPLFDAMLVQQGEGSGTPTEPYHTPSPEAPSPSHTTHTSPSLPPITFTSIPTVTPTETTPIRQYTRRARIAQSSTLPTIADEPASPQRDVSQREACSTDSCFIADQDRANIAKTSTLPHESTSRVTSLAADEGTQALEITELKARVKFLEDRQGEGINISRDDDQIKERRLDEEEVATERVSSDTEEIRLDEVEVAAERVSDDTKEMTTVLIIMDAASVLSSRGVQIEDFIPMGSKDETKRIKRIGINLEQESAKKQKISEEVPEEVKSSDEENLTDYRWSIKFRGGLLGIKCKRHSHCQLQSSHYQNNFPLPEKKDATAKRKGKPLPGRLYCYQS
nr:hypothetical protein [Tanacetum cinerariifolium]